MTDDRQNVQRTEGYLEKRGKLKFINSWTKYWFVLEGHLLLYYGSKDDYDALSPCKGSITLGPTCVVKPYSSPPIGFQIATRSSTVILKAKNINEQTKWMQAVLSTIKQNQTPNRSPTKLNHFRYSNETVDALMNTTETKKEISPDPCSPKLRKSKNMKFERKESDLIDRLQKLGARSYSDGFENQNLIRGSRNLKHLEISDKTENKGTILDEHFVLESSPTNKPQKNDKDGKVNFYSELHKKKKEKRDESPVIENENFCVCALSSDEKRETQKEDKINREENHTKDQIYFEPNNNYDAKLSQKPKEVVSLIDSEYDTCDNEIYTTCEFSNLEKNNQKTTTNKSINLEVDNEIYGSIDKLSKNTKETYYEPTEVYENPDEVYENPEEVYENPKEVYETSEEVYETPEEVYEIPGEVYENPDEVYEDPNELSSRSSKKESILPEFQYTTSKFDEIDNDLSDVEYEELDEETTGEEVSEYTELKEEICELIQNLCKNHELKDNSIYSSSIQNENNNNQVVTSDVVCENDIYGKAISLEKKITSDIFPQDTNPEKNVNLYEEPLYTETEENEEENVYEDLEQFVFRTLVDNQTKEIPLKEKKQNKNRTRVKLEEHKKQENLIQRLLMRQKAKKKIKTLSVEKDKIEEQHVSDVDETLVLLTNCQDLLEQGKTIIEAIAEKNRTASKQRLLLGDKMTSGKSNTQMSPDLLQNLNDHLVLSGKLSEEYSVDGDKLPPEAHFKADSGGTA